jgi:hypothetical protein
MNQILELIPTDIFLCVINDWLKDNFEDVANFDLAFCHRSSRLIYLENSVKEISGYELLDDDYDDNTLPTLHDKFLTWVKLRKFKLVSFSTTDVLVYVDRSITSRVQNEYKFIKKLHCTQEHYIGELWKVLLVLLNELPDLIDLTLQCEIKHRSRNFKLLIDDVEKGKQYGLKVVQFNGCVDYESFPFILALMENHCKVLESIAFNECPQLKLQLIAPFLPSFQSLKELVVCLENLGTPSVIPFVTNNVDISSPRYNYDLPNLKKVRFKKCGGESDIVIAIIDSALHRQLEEIHIEDFYAPEERSSQLVGIISGRVNNRLKSLNVLDSSWYEIKHDEFVFQPDLTTLTLHNPGPKIINDNSMQTITNNLPNLAQLEIIFCRTISDQSFQFFINNSQCFNCLVKVALHRVHIGRTRLYELIEKCLFIQDLYLNLDIGEEFGFGPQFFVELLGLPNVQTLIDFNIELDRKNRSFVENRQQIDEIIATIYSIWQFPNLKYFCVTSIFINEDLFMKIFDSPKLMGCRIFAAVPLLENNEYNTNMPKFGSINARCDNTDVMRRNRNKFKSWVRK